MKKLILLRGYPGSGKTTIGKALEQHGHGIFLDHNAILTFIAGFTGDDNGIYEHINSLEQAMTRKLLYDGKDVIAARGFSSARSIDPYLKIAADNAAEITIFRLVATDEILSTRVQSPERKRDFNPTTSPEALRQWIGANPLKAVANEKLIDASQPVHNVLKVIQEFIASGPVK